MNRNTSVRYPGGRGSLWGALAYVVGFGATYALVSSRLSWFLSEAAIPTGSTTFALSDLTQEAHVPTWKWASLAFYNSHFMDVVASGLPGGIRGSRQQVNLLTEAGGVFFPLLLVTPLLLVVAGAFATRKATDPVELRFDVFGTGKNRFFVNGALVVFFGYFPLAVLGAILASASLDGNAAIQTDLLKSFVVAGAVYPFVFGGLGGYLRSHFA